jgi:thermitase
MLSKFLALILSILALSLTFSGLSFETSASTVSQSHISSQVLVKFKVGTSQGEINSEFSRHRAKVIDEVRALGVLVLSVPASAEERVIAGLSRNPKVEYAELNGLAVASMTPDDPYFAPNQWGLHNTSQDIKGTVGTVDADIDGPEAWDVTTGGVKVAILDTGIDQDHEDLSFKITDQRNFSDSGTIDDLYGHGTHVGGIVAAVTNNGIGVAGGCPICTLMNGKVLNDSGSGSYSWVANGITWATDNGAKVINMSLGGSTKSKTLERAVNYAWNKGVILAAAAGNGGNNRSKTYPAAYTNVIAVASTNNLDQKSSFSSFGASWVDVAAPGENIFSTFPNHPFKIQELYGRSQNYDFASGTSMATPMTAAAAALIWTTSYGTSASSVRSRVESTADKIAGTGTYWSAGRVNADAAVSP